jgi:hypothetical protein
VVVPSLLNPSLASGETRGYAVLIYLLSNLPVACSQVQPHTQSLGGRRGIGDTMGQIYAQTHTHTDLYLDWVKRLRLTSVMGCGNVLL